MEISWFVIVLLATLLLTVLTSYLLVKHYANPHESTHFTSFISTISLTITLFCLLLIPLDIYTVSSGLNPDGTHQQMQLLLHSAQTIQVLYYIFYSLLLAFAFGVVPFTYFYFEEGDDETPTSTKCFGALKATAGFVLFFLILLICGVVLHKSSSLPADENTSWQDRLQHDFNTGDSILAFSIAALATLGLIFFVPYTGYGLASLPLKLMNSAIVTSQQPASVRVGGGGARLGSSSSSRSSSSASHSISLLESGSNEVDVEFELRRTEENINYLSSQYQASENMSKEDKRQIEQLKREQRRLLTLKHVKERKKDSRRGSRSSILGRNNNDEDDDSGECCSRVWNAFAIVRISIAVPLVLLSLFLISSLLISIVDKISHSPCGPSCGYALTTPSILNPIDESLRYLSRAFPMDAIAFMGLVLFIYLCCLHGIVSLGIRLLFFKLYTIVRKRTQPHALLFLCWILMFCALILNLQVVTLAPHYTNFGNQFLRVYNNTTHEYDRMNCELSDVGVEEELCLLTNVGKFVENVNVQLPFFAVVLFYANVVMVGVFVFCFVVGLWRSREERKRGRGNGRGERGDFEVGFDSD